MALCPLTAKLENGTTKMGPCLAGVCALAVNGCCSFRILAEKALLDAKNQSKPDSPQANK